MATFVLTRRDPGTVAVAEVGGATVDVAAGDLAGWVAEREAPGTRWVWDDTARWYPALLAAGVRVAQCTDLRLQHVVLRHSPWVDQALWDPADAARWDALEPAATAVEDTLFDVADHVASLDVTAEFDRQRRAVASSSDPGRLTLLLAAESAAALAAAEMTFVGLPWRADVHRALLADLLGERPRAGERPPKLEPLVDQARAALGAPGLNPDSPADLLTALRRAGLDVTDTRSWTLERVDHPAVAPLLEYRRLMRLHTANGWHWLDTWVRDGRYRTRYLPGGVVTGRWAATGGGALSLPGPLRPSVVADDGWRLVVADVAQLEPRVLAAMAGDLDMARAARGADLYQGLVDAGAVETRADAKVGMLGAMYGGTSGDSGRIVERLKRRFPRAFDTVEAAARAGERGEVVHSRLGRGSPRPTATWVGRLPADEAEAAADRRDARSWGRFTRNFVVQGTGAEWALCWLATLRRSLWELGTGPLPERPHLVFFLHDEVVVHTPAPLADAVVEAVQAAALDATRLLFADFPLEFPLDVAVVEAYDQAG
ncbi:bifunctional 3'-5' exonuclease/DNA polymerase [Jatrophihabitans sp. YIM 134969]